MSETQSGQGAQGQQPSARARLIGAWRYVGTTLDGRRCERGADPRGMIYYGPDGEMAVQVAPGAAAPRAGAAITADEALIALKDYIAYFGTYTVDETAGTVTHHRLGSVQPGDRGDLVRHYEFSGDRLVLRAAGANLKITWQRIG